MDKRKEFKNRLLRRNALGRGRMSAGAPADGAPTPGQQGKPATRWDTLINFRNEFLDREEALRLREAVALVRERALSRRESEALPDANLDAVLLTQLREANENLVIASIRSQSMTEAAEHANVLKEQFLAMLAHEMRNPLAPLVNALEVLRHVKSEDPLLPWARDIMKRQIGHLTRLVDDLLDVSRINTGKVQVSLEPAILAEIMGQAVEASRPMILERRQSLTIHVPPQPLTVMGDAVRLVQVFSNLLNNAAKYTGEGGAICFSANVQPDNRVMVSVSDNGHGIAAEMLPHIFELFTQEDRSLARSSGGLGIGLTVARAVIQMHAGTITARSDGPEQGTTFEVLLPLVASDASPEAAAGPAPVSTPVSYRILIIEDNPDTAGTMKALLELMGHEVATAFDGPAGVQRALADRPQVVLCDLGLPVMDGYQVAAQLRADMPQPQPLMIAVTGYGKPEDTARVAAAGFDAHLIKPLLIQDLLMLLSEHARVLSPSSGGGGLMAGRPPQG